MGVARAYTPQPERYALLRPDRSGGTYASPSQASLLNNGSQALEKWADFGQVTPGVANGQSEIKLERLEFHRPDSVANQYGPDEGWTGLIQAVLFEVNDRDKIGYPTAQGYRYCCVKELVPKTKCHLDRLIYQVQHAAATIVISVFPSLPLPIARHGPA